MGYASTVKRLWKKHEIMFIVAVQKLVKNAGMTEKQAIKYLKG